MGMTPIVGGERAPDSKISSIIKDLKRKMWWRFKGKGVAENLPIEAVPVSFTEEDVKEYTER